MDVKPLFIPLKTEFYEEFENGRKDTEYRVFGPRWNFDTCKEGRRVVLSHGYGKRRRMSGTIVRFSRCFAPDGLPGWVECYGERSGKTAALITIKLDKPKDSGTGAG